MMLTENTLESTLPARPIIDQTCKEQTPTQGKETEPSEETDKLLASHNDKGESIL